MMGERTLRFWRWCAGVLALLTFAANPAFSADERRVALIIGNAAYETVPTLANPRNDAEDMAAALTEMGFEVVEGYDLDFDGMRAAMRQFSTILDGADVGLLFYAGHGLQVDGRNYMAPVDAKLDSKEDLEFEAIDMSRILAMMEREPRVNLIFLDACRDNPLADSLSAAMGGSRSIGGGNGLARLETVAIGSLIAYSTQPGATAADGVGRNSPFTTALMDHIRSPGLEIQQMMRRVRARVVDETARKQVPWDNSSLISDFYFIPPPEGASPAPVVAGEPSERQIEIRYWFDVKNSGSIDEIQSYLAKYPEGEFAGAAAARINGLKLKAAAPGGDPSSLEALYARLAKRSILVEEPSQAHEFYNNARLYELRSDALNAGKMYAKFLTFGLSKVDPHYAYQDYLKAQEGRAGAREAYNEMAYDHPDDAVMKFAAILLQSPERRKTQMEAYVDANPDFAPAVLALSDEYSLRRLGSQTIADKRREFELLERFNALVDAGNFYTHFMDQRLAQETLESAQERLRALQSALQPNLERPLTMNAQWNNAGWMLTFISAEQMREVFVALPGEDFESLGFLGMTNPMSGQPMAKMFKNLPKSAEAMTLRAKYVDLRGEEQGPWDFDFDPLTARLANVRQTLEFIKPNWVSLQPNPADESNWLLYFSYLTTDADMLAEVRYGLNTDTPDIDYPITRWHKGEQPYEDEDDPLYIYVDVPDDTEYVSVQITFIDGQKTEIVRSTRNE